MTWQVALVCAVVVALLVSGALAVLGVVAARRSRRTSSPPDPRTFELHDTLLQGLVASKMALDLGDVERAQAVLALSIAAASQAVTDQLDEGRPRRDLLRSAPAELGPCRPRQPEGSA